MTVITGAGAGLLDRIAASRGQAARQGLTAAAAGAARVGGAGAAAGVTQVTLGSAAAQESASPVYARPVSAFQTARSWGTPPGRDDTVSALMSRNLGGSPNPSLADQWKGLGGALLARFAEAPGSYQQSLVSFAVPLAAEDGEVPAGGMQAPGGDPSPGRAGAAAVPGTSGLPGAAAMDGVAGASPASEALAGLAAGAATVGMQIMTRSGERIELKILVNDGSSGTAGLQVQISGPATLTNDEKAAVAALSPGLDKALQGLGQRKAAQLDLSGLSGFDSSQLASIDLKVENPREGAALSAFALHLGDDHKSVALDGAAGQVRLKVDTSQALADLPPTRRWAAIHQQLEKMDAAGSRSHADRQVVEQMKDAFQQLQSAGLPPPEASKAGEPVARTGTGAAAPGRAGPAGAAGAAAGAGAGAGAGAAAADTGSLSTGREPGVQALRSGLADFEASFEAEVRKLNRFGAVKESGEARYQLSQDTRTEPNAATGGTTVTQTMKEQLDARWQRALDGQVLSPGLGHYTAHAVEDSSTVATLIETAADGSARALRKTDRQALQTDSTILDHRLAARTGTPVRQRWMERLSA